MAPGLYSQPPRGAVSLPGVFAAPCWTQRMMYPSYHYYTRVITIYMRVMIQEHAAACCIVSLPEVQSASPRCSQPPRGAVSLPVFVLGVTDQPLHFVAAKTSAIQLVEAQFEAPNSLSVTVARYRCRYRCPLPLPLPLPVTVARPLLQQHHPRRSGPAASRMPQVSARDAQIPDTVRSFPAVGGRRRTGFLVALRGLRDGA
jgi:hypothetical protein